MKPFDPSLLKICRVVIGRVFWASWRGFLCFFCKMLETIHIILLAFGPKSKAQSPTFPTRSLSMVLRRGHLPLTRLRVKTSPPQQSKTRHQTLRAAAVKEGLAPKARKAFALYVMDKSQVKAGAGRDAFALEMRRLGREWAALPSSLKAHYRERSATEFQCQRDALLRAGIMTSKLPSPVQQMEKNQGKKIKVGPYTVVVEASGEDENAGWTVLGSGSYGKVFLAATPQGQPCAVKVFSGRHAAEGAQYEADLLKSLASLSACDSQWFPLLLAASPSAEPWPWMSSSFGAPDWLKWFLTVGR